MLVKLWNNCIAFEGNYNYNKVECCQTDIVSTFQPRSNNIETWKNNKREGQQLS